MVGCVIVKNNRIIGEGYHQYAGGPHAETIALQQAGKDAVDATLYVTLEPCCHVGKTPPCTTSLIQSGIKKIFIACIDPNPLVAGKGIDLLRSAHIEVEIGLCESEANKLNEVFFHYIKHKRPFVFAKWAMSLDGKTITHRFDSKNISSHQSRQKTHQLRQQVDAILIGANTAKQDNPLLTVRPDTSTTKIIKHPIRIVLSSLGDLPLDLNIFDTTMPGKTIVATTDAVDRNWYQAIRQKKIDIIIVPANKQGRVDLNSLLHELGKKEMSSLLVEGGMTVHHQFFAGRLVNQIQVYLAPVIIGDFEKKHQLTHLQFSQIENDFHFIGDVEDSTHV
jgi:diaminohydroxyphosphoribosylaminopyrimidine deaminase/5-amino-6-(5-phosphoribosylamino)uracil reductase